MKVNKTVREFTEATNQMMDKCKKQAGAMVFNDEMDADALDLMKDMFNLCDVALQLVCEQANTIHEINDKLDRLLEKNED